MSEFLIDVQPSKEQDKITQVVTGASGAQMKPTTYDEYISASKGKAQKGKGKGTDSKGTINNWRQPCTDYWRPDGGNLGHSCPKYPPRRRPLNDVQSVDPRSTIPHNVSDQSSRTRRKSSMRTTVHGVSQQSGMSPGNPKPGRLRSMERPKARRARAIGQSQKPRGHHGQLPQELPRIKVPDPRDLSPNPNLKQAHARLMDTCSP